jgi:hypothetical protein
MIQMPLVIGTLEVLEDVFLVEFVAHSPILSEGRKPGPNHPVNFDSPACQNSLYAGGGKG